MSCGGAGAGSGATGISEARGGAAMPLKVVAACLWRTNQAEQAGAEYARVAAAGELTEPPRDTCVAAIQVEAAVTRRRAPNRPPRLPTLHPPWCTCRPRGRSDAHRTRWRCRCYGVFVTPSAGGSG
jgi:hypothetical protein